MTWGPGKAVWGQKGRVGARASPLLQGHPTCAHLLLLRSSPFSIPTWVGRRAWAELEVWGYRRKAGQALPDWVGAGLLPVRASLAPVEVAPQGPLIVCCRQDTAKCCTLPLPQKFPRPTWVDCSCVIQTACHSGCVAVTSPRLAS